MPHSDEFGFDDDDSAFLLAATQAEASQHGHFEPSPRPSKRRRVSRKGPSNLDGAGAEELEWPATDGEAHSSPRSSHSFRNNGPAATKFIQATQNPPSDELEDDADEYYFPGELENIPIEEVRKNSRFKIHVPENGQKFPDMIFTQTQHGLDERPEAFRGAIWKRPPKPAAPTYPQKRSDMGRGSAPIRKETTRNGINNYFAVQEDDAAMAARLQAEEDALEKRRHVGTGSQAVVDATQELADLPDDAFSSSSPEKSPRKNAPIEISSQLTGTQQPYRQQALRGPQTGLKQMTIFGQPATQDLSASQTAQKKHAWPLANKDEPPTHHKLDEKAMVTWVYPTNLGSIRDYQFNIVSRSLFHNTLVALPTGLGKTFIAATVMLNYYRWTADAQIVFMAPTKPLIAQQLDACYGIVGIPKRDTVLMTGETTPAVRAEEWLERRVFFMTPQTVINDLRTGICDPKKIVLLVVDEAHKATGGYAYTEVIQFMRRFNSSFRVLALTATPGGTTESVQAVIDNLGIARVELRTETSIDIRQYTHEKQTETQVFDFSEEQERIMSLFAKALQPVVDKLCSQNAYYFRDPMQLTAYGLTQARQRYMGSEAGRKAPQPVKGMVNAIFTVLSSLAHSISLLKYHGIGPFYGGVLAFQRDVQSGATKGKTATNIVHDENFTKMMSTIRTWTNDPDFIGHPKLEYLRQVVLSHFLDAGEGRQGSDVPPSATRVMVFASYRDSTEEICRVLKRDSPMIRPQVFVGQAASKGQEGMNQKRQNEVIQDFKSGKFNTLIATSIGEEGLDIGTVDLIVCYDASSSPIRMLQRIGRTGRKRTGQVVLLLTKGKEEKDYEKAQDNYAYIQKTIADASKYNYRDDQSPRILPKDVRPIADKRPVEIPVENSQPVDLNEKSKKARGRGKAKRPPKKFHMPDNVRTGFVKASKLGSDSEAEASGGEVEFKKPAKAPAATKKPVPPVFRKLSLAAQVETVSMPPLEDVLLTNEEQIELETSYAHTAGDDGDGFIRAPDYERFPNRLRNLGATKYVGHGRAAQLVEKGMKSMHEVNGETFEKWDEILHLSDLEDAGSATERLISPNSKPAQVAKQASTSTKTVKPTTSTKPRGRPKTVLSPMSVVLPVESDSDTAGRSDSARPALGAKRPRRRPKTATNAPAVDHTESRPGLTSSPVRLPAPKPRGRPKKAQSIQRVQSYGEAAAEGESSSPERTPADMRIATQIAIGEDIGTQDTSGDDGPEEQPNSDDMAFIQRSGSVEMASSSQHVLSSSQTGTPVARKTGGRLKRKPPRRASILSDVEEIGESEDELGLELEHFNGPGESEIMIVGAVAKGRKRAVVQDSDDE